MQHNPAPRSAFTHFRAQSNPRTEMVSLAAPSLQSKLPRLTVREAIEREQARSVWKHGCELKSKFHTFEVDQNLVEKYRPRIQALDSKIGEILQATDSECNWQTLFTHPKLMAGYYWRDRKIHDKNQRVLELKKALNISELSAT
jgi:hypothetical protein